MGINLKETVLGIELGSTRIKAVLLDMTHEPIASGTFVWKNRFVDGIWTYPMEEVRLGLQACFANLKRNVFERIGIPFTTCGCIGISGMMHGYLPFDVYGNQLCGFRTWRNTITNEAAKKLTILFRFNIPQRWSVAHYYQAMLNEEPHVKDVRHLTTLAGYMHWQLTGHHVMGIGEASGMFPIDPVTCDYDSVMLAKFYALSAINIDKLLPEIITAGAYAGSLTKEGALLLDPSGEFEFGIPFAPCEGDMGTGMVATNAVRGGTGNVSAGTSANATIITDQSMGVHPEIDIILSPDGRVAALIHANNCTSDINAWVNLFGEFANLIGCSVDKDTLYTKLFESALCGDPDCGGILSYNYYSGEGITGVNAGIPMLLHGVNAKWSLPNFMRAHLCSALATLKIGIDMLTDEEHVKIDKLIAHGGYFKTPEVGQRILSAATGVPISVMETAGEGGPYGMALLCAYRLWRETGETLSDYLDNKAFANVTEHTLMVSREETEGFARFLQMYKRFFAVERKAVEI